MTLNIDISKIKNFKDFMAQPVDTGKLASPSQFADDVIDLFCGENANDGATLPINAFLGGRFRARPAETTLWAGQNGGGKSGLLTMCALHWLQPESSNQEEKILIVSPEMSPTQNLHRLIRQQVCKHPNDVSEAEIKAAIAHFEGRLWIYNHVGSVDTDILKGLIRYAARELGVTQVIFDNITILKFDSDPLKEQKHFITDMVEISRQEKIHVHVVAHSRKPESGQRRMMKYDIRGASEQSDLVDNVILISRNEAKEESLRSLDPLHEDYRKWQREHDTRVDIAKQRHGDGWTGMAKLAFWSAQMRWTDSDKETPRAFKMEKDFF